MRSFSSRTSWRFISSPQRRTSFALFRCHPSMRAFAQACTITPATRPEKTPGPVIQPIGDPTVKRWGEQVPRSGHCKAIAKAGR